MDKLSDFKANFRENFVLHFGIYWRYIYLYILLISLPIFCISTIQHKYFEDNITINTLMFIITMPYVIWAYKFILNMLLFKEYKKIVVTHNLVNVTWKIAIIYFAVQTIAEILCIIICNLFFDSNNNYSINISFIKLV